MIDHSEAFELRSEITPLVDTAFRDEESVLQENDIPRSHVDAFHGDQKYFTKDWIDIKTPNVYVERGLISCTLGVAFVGEKVVLEHIVLADENTPENKNVRYFLTKVGQIMKPKDIVNIQMILSLSSVHGPPSLDKNIFARRRRSESDFYSDNILGFERTYQIWLKENNLTDGLNASLHITDVPMLKNWYDFDITFGDGCIVVWDAKLKQPLAKFSLEDLKEFSSPRS